MHRFLALLAVLLAAACGNHQPTATSGQPVQTIQYDGQAYRLAAGKVNQADVTADLSIEFTYGERNGNRVIASVIINEVEYRADCDTGAIARVTDDGTDTGTPEGCGPTGGSDLPHYTNCSDGQGIRDIDFTCDGYGDFAPNTPGAEDVRLKVEGNEDLLRSAFASAWRLGSFVPHAPSPDGYPVEEDDTTYNLTDGAADFFVIELTQKAHWIISSTGETDTWGDLYKVEGGNIRAIAGTGQWADRGNFAIQQVLEAGTYLLRVTAEQGGTGGAYKVDVFGVLEDG